eukprot:gene7263-biopygen4567
MNVSSIARDFAPAKRLYSAKMGPHLPPPLWGGAAVSPREDRDEAPPAHLAEAGGHAAGAVEPLVAVDEDRVVGRVAQRTQRRRPAPRGGHTRRQSNYCSTNYCCSLCRRCGRCEGALRGGAGKGRCEGELPRAAETPGPELAGFLPELHSRNSCPSLIPGHHARTPRTPPARRARGCAAPPPHHKPNKPRALCTVSTGMLTNGSLFPSIGHG